MPQNKKGFKRGWRGGGKLSELVHNCLFSFIRLARLQSQAQPWFRQSRMMPSSCLRHLIQNSPSRHPSVTSKLSSSVCSASAGEQRASYLYRINRTRPYGAHPAVFRRRVGSCTRASLGISAVSLYRNKLANEAMRLVSSTACGRVFSRGAAATRRLVMPDGKVQRKPRVLR